MVANSHLYSVLKFLFLALLFLACQAEAPNPLRVSDVNPRYFTNDSGKAIYLTGSHTWDNLVDINDPDKETPFDYEAYLEFLTSHNHNFIRLWTWDLLNMVNESNMSLHYVPLHPWERAGPENALDGQPKFDLTVFNQAYFDRLRERVEAAGKQNIYVSVMLFEGWGLQFSEEGYKNHLFHPLNNVNQLGLDTADHTRFAIYQLSNDKVLELQERYVEKVIASVGDLDNILYEISNENHAGSTEWQYHMIRYIKEREKENGISHPVGMTYQHKGGINEDLFDSPADWISPHFTGGYKGNPPLASGQKVIITDTDHLWGIGGDREWVWKSFLRGLNPIFMDPYRDQVFVMDRDDEWERARVAMGYTLEFAKKMDLINMVPDSSLSASKYCLANTGEEYLVYLPEQTETTLDLSDASGVFDVSWFDTNNGATKTGNAVEAGSKVKLIAPFNTPGAVAHLVER